MHLLIIAIALIVAFTLRLTWANIQGNWRQRWQKSLFFFLFSPLLLIVTAFSVLCMGPTGKMVGFWDGWLSQVVASMFLSTAIFLCLKLFLEGSKYLKQIRTYSQIEINEKSARLLNAPILFTAQVGFWQPELIVSQGLLQNLDPEHLEAVLAHEQAHYYYRDTFWFCCLGWLRQVTAWLPNTDALWEELLTLREMRADAKAAQQVDALLLAESLLLVVSYPHFNPENFCAAFSVVAPSNRLSQRIDALLAEPLEQPTASCWFWSWLILAFFPLLTIPFHF